ncbi:MAG TPA: glycerol-3-phosphate dehydrogenase [Candidatus Paceibacterota bacterium]|nr:glycerol-3-phosphate dehydrogenase [Candidatus Paceibacterota bacterium]
MFDSRLDPDQHRDALVALSNEKFDVLVIGGGITGVGAALDAASRGLRVALIEAHDLASGTSSRSSKLIHGGLRYLEQYDFRLVREALQERESMVTSLAPHLVKPVAFLYPLHEKLKDRTYVGAGLALYDVLRGFQRALPWHKHLSQKNIAQIAPSLRQDIVTGAIKYFDAQVDDARYTMMVARTAARHGAVIATGVACESLIREGQQVTGAVVRNLENDQLVEVQAGVTVMCAGVWSDDLHEKFGLKPGYEVRMSKGAHIVLPGSAIKSEAGIILKTPVSVLFVIPWEDKWIVGTTDTEYTGDRNEPLANREDVDYILAQANRILEPVIRSEDIIGVYAGLRPLVSKKADALTTKLSREHTVDRPAPGFVSIAGGKYTTYRVMAQDVIDLAAKELNEEVSNSITSKLPIVGADGYIALVQQVTLISAETGLAESQVLHLLNRYGSLISEILDLITEDSSLAEPLANDLPYLRAEIHYAASHEGARSVDDVVSRRTRISFESRENSVELLDEIAKIIAPILGWNRIERVQSIERYREIYRQERQATTELLEKQINS